MSLEVIGAGFGRTGTLSLKRALEQLGFAPCHHMEEVQAHPETMDFWRRAAEGEAVEWEEVYKDYRATVDWPGCHFWKQLAAAYPDAKVLLSVRPPEKWLASMRETILKLMTEMRAVMPEELRKAFRFVELIIDEQTFHGDYSDENVLAAFNNHVASVKRQIAPERLLVFDVAEGWQPLCKLLGVPVPDTEFPRSNSREEFWEHFVPPDMQQGR